MYTDTSRPNHLAQEVIDNAVDEALAGHARTVEVTLYSDGSCEVADDGRGMPVDLHPEEKIPGVELILTRPCRPPPASRRGRRRGIPCGIPGHRA
jgi:topoisomerase-4 subunit B